MKRNLFGIIFVGLASLGGLTGWGQDVYWTNVNGGTFSDGANWAGGIPPNADQNAYFTSAGGYTVTFSADADNAAGYVQPGNSSTVTLSIASSTWRLTNGLYLGDASGTDGRVVQNSGKLVVTNSSSTPILYIGKTGHGEYELNNAEVVCATLWMSKDGASANNKLIINGSSAHFTASAGGAVGCPGSGNFVAITNGGRMDVLGYLILGRGSDVYNAENNVIHVSGAGSTLACGSFVFNVGGDNLECKNNQLIVSDGGVVTNISGATSFGLFVGANNPSTVSNMVLVTGTGSALYCYSLNVGSHGYGDRLIVTNGGAVTVGEYLMLAQTAGANATLVVTGPGSTVRAGRGYFGESGGNSLSTIANGGFVAFTNGPFVIGDQDTSSSNTCTVTGSGSTIEVDGAYTFSVGGNGGSGNKVTVSAGGCVTGASMMVYIGIAPASIGNRMLITDANSALYCNALTVGNEAFDNLLTISNGAKVVVGGAVNLSRYGSSGSNTILVADGTLIVTNATHDNTMTVGYSSDARMTVQGGGGAITIDRLSLPRSDSTLKFIVNAAKTVTTVKVNDALTIAAGAKLVMDFSAFSGWGTWTLVNYGSKTGSFAVGDITIIGRSAGEVIIDQDTGNNITASIPGPARGTIFKVY